MHRDRPSIFLSLAHWLLSTVQQSVVSRRRSQVPSPRQRSQQRRAWGLALLLGLGAFVPVVQAAERVYVSYSFLERSVSVNALEIFAREGRLTDNLGSYTRFLKAEQRQQFRDVLLRKVELDPLTISQFLYTPIGESLLKRVGEVVKPKGAGSFNALRGALILAADDPEGLTALNVLRHYPTQGIAVDLRRGVELFDQVQKLVGETAQVVASIETQAASNPPVDYGIDSLNLTQPGPWVWQTFTYELADQSDRRLTYTGRARSFPVDVYVPQSRIVTPRPVVVISHGLNSDRSSFQYLAEHYASHGYVVVVPEHPGSNREQIQSLLNGQADDVIDQMEFLDRPLDVSYALDELQRRSQSNTELTGRIDFDRVGIVGQSFGGYTAMALIGAKLDFQTLQADCEANLDDTFNLSLLLQCLALRIPAQDYNLQDDRIKAAIAINPMGSSLLDTTGLQQMNRPLMMISGSADTVAPLVPEQAIPFSKLSLPHQYFLLMNAGTHFSTISLTPGESRGGEDNLPQVEGLTGPRPDIARDYMRAYGLAFMKTHVEQEPFYRQFLEPGFATWLSRDPLPISLVTQIPGSLFPEPKSE